MCEIGEEFGLGMDALETFIYAGYDIGLRVVVYPKTGKTMCIGLDHDGEVVHLEEPVPI